MCTKKQVKEALIEHGIVTQLQCKEISSAIGTDLKLMQQAVKNISQKQDDISLKLDVVIDKKADKEEVDRVRKTVGRLTVLSVTTIFAVLIQIIFFLLGKN